MYFIEKRELIALFLVARGWIFIPTKMKHSMKMMKLSNLNKTFRRGESISLKKKNNADNQHARINDQSYLIPRQFLLNATRSRFSNV